MLEPREKPRKESEKQKKISEEDMQEAEEEVCGDYRSSFEALQNFF